MSEFRSIFPGGTRVSRAVFDVPAEAIQAALILLAVVFIYAPVFQGGWLLDDNLEVTANASVQNPAGLPQIWRGDAGVDYLPLKTTVLWLLWRSSGHNPTPYHCTSIALHFLNALLVWRLLGRLGMRHAWLAGLLFAVHPIEVESVSWVSELKNTLSLALLLLSMSAWLTFDETRRERYYTGALVLFIAALLCKSSVIMLPLLLLLYAWWRRDRIGWEDVALSLPFFAVSLEIGATTVLLQQQRAIRAAVYPLGGLASHAALSGTDVAFYLSKIVLPAGLLPMYPRWRVDPPMPLEFLPWPIIGAALIYAWTKRATRWGRGVFCGLSFFLITLLPVLGFFKMSFMRIAWTSDHLVYLPSLGIVATAAAAIGAIYDHLSRRSRPYALGAGALGLGLLSFESHQYAAGAYSSLDAMCRYTLQSNPDAWLAHQLAAKTAQDRGDYDASLAQATDAVRLKPDVPETQNALANALESKGSYPEAIRHLNIAIRLRPDIAALHFNLAKCLASTGRFEDARNEYSALVEKDPWNAVYHCDLGVCLYKLGRLDEAIAEFHRTLVLDPNLRVVQDYLAAALKDKSARTDAGL